MERGWRSGARLPVADPTKPPVAEAGKVKSRPHQCSECKVWHYPARKDTDSDPAKGERVPRCLACGSPSDVIEFALLLGAKHPGIVRLCGHCYYEQNPIDPQAGDPLAA